jgi:hypothetical protein
MIVEINMLDLPFPCKIYRVHCCFCRQPIGHIIVDKEATEQQALNRAHSVFKLGEIHNPFCERERNMQDMITSKNKYEFTVGLL